MSWKHLLRQSFTSLGALADYLELTHEQRQSLLQTPHFVLNLPFRLARKIQKGCLADPILLQFVPTRLENVETPHYRQDPVGDLHFRATPKLLKKYEGRALLLVASACAMHCRYCFRQNFDYERGHKGYEEEWRWIERDPSIKEVILSGGDPLSISDTSLGLLLERVASIPHIKRLRFHTRFPIGIPERIDDSFLALLEKVPQQIWFVIHCNHPQELDEDIFFYLRKLQKKGIVIMNQAVLLRGVNDRVDVLQALCEVLADHGILPYYLHQLDRVQGAAHFEVPEEEGKCLLKELTARLSGYAVPKYVKEVAGEGNKTSLTFY